MASELGEHSRTRTTWLTGFIGLMLATTANAAVDRATASRIESAIQAIVHEHNIVGLQVAIGMDGDLAWSDAFGQADVEHDVPVSEATLFRTASVSKWMTASVALRLVELGKLDLDAPIQTYCPQYPEKRWTLTSRHLLTHRGGVRHYWGANGEPRDTEAQQQRLRELSSEERRWMSTRYTDVIEPLNRFKDDPLLFEPDTDFQYTSNGYRLLGCVLRGAADASYDDLMQQHVFGPAGMTSTINDDAYAIVPGRARGYTLDDDGNLIRARFRDVSENLPAGGHLSTASDLIEFAMAWQAGKLVSESSRTQMTTPPEGVDGSEQFYGLGVGVRFNDGERLVSHSGGQDGARSMLILNTDTGDAVAWMTNYERIPQTLTQLIVDATAEAFGD